ncbi:MAG TPA: hypothetical protein P5201_05630, partial [Aminobacteriaceae bacterium]|nr:hypothetical protein [Aminobacteriaceae bacterium]
MMTSRAERSLCVIIARSRGFRETKHRTTRLFNVFRAALCFIWPCGDEPEICRKKRGKNTMGLKRGTVRVAVVQAGSVIMD